MTSDHCAMEEVQALPQTTSGTDASTEKMGLIVLQSLQPVLESGANWKNSSNSAELKFRYKMQTCLK